MTAASFFLLLLFLFLLSRIVAQNLGQLIYRLTRSKTLTVNILALILLPGTAVHEFAHASVAQGLGVYVGDIKLMPEVDGKNIKLGSVKIAECDPFRRFLIGIAPLIVGLASILIILRLYEAFDASGFWPSVLLFYVLFQIGNTMFSSNRDLEGAVELFLAASTIAVLSYLAGAEQFFSWLLSQKSTLDPFFALANSSLLKIVIIDVIVVAAAKFLNSSKRRN